MILPTYIWSYHNQVHKVELNFIELKWIYITFHICILAKWRNYLRNTVRWKMYYQKKIKQGCYMVNFIKLMIHMHLWIKNKMNMWALFWFDQNYRFLYSKIDHFWGWKMTPKNSQFYYKKICNFDPIKKGLTYWFCFWCINAYGS